MPKFFVPEAAPGARFLVLTGENAAHAKVLRLKPGERVTVCDAKGTDFQCTVSDVAGLHRFFLRGIALNVFAFFHRVLLLNVLPLTSYCSNTAASSAIMASSARSPQ